MSRLRESLEDYLTIRRALGYKLETQGRMLADFLAFADEAGARIITTDLALAWALLPSAATPGWAARRLHVVQGFARYLQTIEPDTEVSPAGLLVGRNHRPTPYLYSEEEVCALLSAARTLSPPLRAATVGTVIGLLAVSGPGSARRSAWTATMSIGPTRRCSCGTASSGTPGSFRFTPAPSRRSRPTASCEISSAHGPWGRASSSPPGAPGLPMPPSTGRSVSSWSWSGSSTTHRDVGPAFTISGTPWP